MRLDRITRELARAYVFGTGFGERSAGGVVAFLKTDAGVKLPDVQFLFNAGSMAAKPYLPPFCRPFRRLCLPGGTVAAAEPWPRRAWLGRPARAAAHPAELLAVEDDLKILRAGLRMAREVGRQSPLTPFVGAETTPLNSDADIDAHIRATGITVHHPAGTCRMGTDDARGGRPATARSRRRIAPRGRRLGDSGPRRRQYQRAGHHDCREGLRHDPRPPRAGTEQRVMPVIPGRAKRGARKSITTDGASQVR